MERVLPCGMPCVMVCGGDCACSVCVDCVRFEKNEVKNVIAVSSKLKSCFSLWRSF